MTAGRDVIERCWNRQWKSCTGKKVMVLLLLLRVKEVQEEEVSVKITTRMTRTTG